VNPVRRLHRAFREAEEIFVVQIGSNDGLSGDPLHAFLVSRSTWKALLVEPVPFLFERLKSNYLNNPRIQFENVAIGEQEGISPFYYLIVGAKSDHPQLPSWADQLGSFDRNHIVRHLGEEVGPRILTLEIPTICFQTLLERNRIFKIDLLHIDAEGFDWIILRQLDLNKYRPKVILFEHRHLTPETKKEALDVLAAYYTIADLDWDYFCLRK